MRSEILRLAVAMVVIFVTWECIPALGEDDHPRLHPRLAYAPINVEKVSSEVIPFADRRNQVSVAVSSSRHVTVRVEFELAEYKGAAVAKADSQTITKPGLSWNCYELRSTDKGVPYSWYMWLTDPFARVFRLFTTRDGDSYLSWSSWTSRGDVFFVSVSKAMDRAEMVKRLQIAMNSDFADGGTDVRIQRVTTWSVLSQACLDSTEDSTNYTSAYLTSLEKDKSGGFQIQVRGEDPFRVHTLVSDKRAEFGWRLADPPAGVSGK